MFLFFFVIFFTLPIIEIYFLMAIGKSIGSLNTITLVMLTAILGAILVRSEGISTVLRIKRALRRNELPALELVEGGILIISAVLLLTPGFVTDSIGLFFLLPPTRRLSAEFAVAHIIAKNVDPHRPDHRNTNDTDYKIED